MKTKKSPNGAILQYAYWVWSLDYVCCVVFIRWGICVLGIVPLLRSSIRFYLCVPRVPYRALPSFHPGLCRSVALSGLIARFCLCFPRVSFRALPSFHPGLCGSAALSGLIARFCLCVPRVPYRALPSFHPGLCRSVAPLGLFFGLGVCGVASWYCVR